MGIPKIARYAYYQALIRNDLLNQFKNSEILKENGFKKQWREVDNRKEYIRKRMISDGVN